MCLAVPVRIDAIEDESTAIASIDGLRKAINISLVPDAEVGDYVILHVGFALKKLDPEEAAKTLALFEEINGMAASEALAAHPGEVSDTGTKGEAQ
ncbi:MAG: HypC/HybG/HupF family hydrogenase formation chaperone [Oceanobacter sp.]